jgi:hypothetical protein
MYAFIIFRKWTVVRVVTIAAYIHLHFLAEPYMVVHAPMVTHMPVHAHTL